MFPDGSPKPLVRKAMKFSISFSHFGKNKDKNGKWQRWGEVEGEVAREGGIWSSPNHHICKDYEVTGDEGRFCTN
jgi:hypothetical protein